MAATRGTVQGFQKDGRPQQHTIPSALGHGSVEARADTWKTFSFVTMRADGSGYFQVTRNGETLHHVSWEAE